MYLQEGWEQGFNVIMMHDEVTGVGRIGSLFESEGIYIWAWHLDFV